MYEFLNKYGPETRRGARSLHFKLRDAFKGGEERPKRERERKNSKVGVDRARAHTRAYPVIAQVLQGASLSRNREMKVDTDTYWFFYSYNSIYTNT